MQNQSVLLSKDIFERIKIKINMINTFKRKITLLNVELAKNYFTTQGHEGTLPRIVAVFRVLVIKASTLKIII